MAGTGREMGSHCNQSRDPQMNMLGDSDMDSFRETGTVVERRGFTAQYKDRLIWSKGTFIRGRQDLSITLNVLLS